MNDTARLGLSALGACLLAIAPLSASAAGAVPVESSHAIEYLNGGVGMAQEQAMRQEGRRFPLRMTFSEGRSDAFVADVPVVIADAKGKPVFRLAQAGPMLDVMLPHGKYEVSATFGGKTERRRVTLAGNEHRALHFHWSRKPA